MLFIYKYLISVVEPFNRNRHERAVQTISTTYSTITPTESMCHFSRCTVDSNPAGLSVS